MLTLGSLFDGIGGFPLSGLQHGIQPVWASEIEELPLKVTGRHFPNMKQLGDITKIDGSKIDPVDIICGGFPCQDLSVAGKREGFQGERSVLFFDAMRIIEEMLITTNYEYPKAIVIENVPGLLSSNKGKDMEAVLEAIEEIGFMVDVNILDAQYMGVPQRRRRVFFVCLNTRYFIKHPVDITINSSYQLLVECLKINLDGIISTQKGCPVDIKSNLNRKTAFIPKDILQSKIQGDWEKVVYGGFDISNESILFCADLLLVLAGNILKHPKLPVAEQILLEIRRCIEHARQSGGDLFTEMEWVHNWNDYIKRASDKVKRLDRYITGEYPTEILSESQSMSRDIKKGRKEGEDPSSSIGESPEKTGTGEAVIFDPYNNIQSEKCSTLGTNCGMSTGRSIVMRSKSGTLRARAGSPKTASDWESLIIESKDPVIMRGREGKEGGGKEPLLTQEKTFTLGCNNDQVVFSNIKAVPDEKIETDEDKEAKLMVIEPRSQDGVCRIHTGGISPTLNTAQGGQRQPCVLAFAANQRDEVRDLGNKTGALQSQPGMKQQTFIAEPIPAQEKQPKIFAICADQSNSMLSNNPKSGIYRAETARTLDGNGGNPACNQGGIAIVKEDCTPNGIAGTVTSKWAKGTGGPSGSEHYNLVTMPEDPNTEEKKEYSVRRLTPLETERLQGFPDDWTNMGSDTARYRATGNSIAVPVVSFVLGQVAKILNKCQ